MKKSELQSPTTNDLAENDIELANEGHKYQSGELDWYLDDKKVSLFNKFRIRRIKKRLNI